MSKEVAVTFQEAVSEVKRELAIRKRFYPKWINSGRLKEEDATRQIARMQAALHIMNELLESKSGPTALFRLRTEAVEM